MSKCAVSVTISSGAPRCTVMCTSSPEHEEKNLKRKANQYSCVEGEVTAVWTKEAIDGVQQMRGK